MPSWSRRTFLGKHVRFSRGLQLAYVCCIEVNALALIMVLWFCEVGEVGEGYRETLYYSCNFPTTLTNSFCHYFSNCSSK